MASEKIKVTITCRELQRAVTAMAKLGEENHFHIVTSLKLAKLGAELIRLWEPVVKARNMLIKKHASEDAESKTFGVKESSRAMANFIDEEDELLSQEVEVAFDGIIMLPLKIASTCDRCHNNMEKPYEIKHSLLLPLLKFIEIKEG